MLSMIAARRSSSSRRYVSRSSSVAQLRVVEPAGGFLAVAGDEGHGGFVIEQRDRGLDLGHAYLELVSNSSSDGDHGVVRPDGVEAIVRAGRARLQGADKSELRSGDVADYLVDGGFEGEPLRRSLMALTASSAQ